MKIKVLFMMPNLSHGGAEKVLINLVNNLNKDKFDVTVMTLFDEGVNRKFLNSDIEYCSKFKHQFRGNSHLLKLLSSEQLYSYCVKKEYDIIVSYLEGPTTRIVAGCNKKNTKLVTWIHGEQCTERNAARAYRNIEEAQKCYQKYNKIICVSEYVKKDLMSLFSINNPVEVLYNTNESSMILEQAQEEVEGIFYDGEIKIIGVGKVIPNKGFDRLARIHCRLRHEGYPIHTFILGVGNQQKEIENYIKRQHEEKSFSFLGYQTNPYKYVSKCDLFVCSSHAEGFSTAATEALIVGTPVITTRVSGMEEMLGSHNEYGVIVDPTEEALYDGIKRLVEHPDMLQYYRQQAIIRGKDFSKEKTVKAVEDMLESVIR